MNILITGASGFIGSSLVEYILENRFEFEKVYASYRSSHKGYKLYTKYKKNPRFFSVVQSVEEPFPEIEVDYIIHAASPACTPIFSLHPANVMTSNIIGTYNILKWAKNNSLKALLFISSGSVYGENPVGSHIYEDDYFNLDYMDKKNSYAEGKRASEALCMSFFHEYGIPTKIVRLGHTYGPGIDLNDGRVFSDFIKRIINYQDLIIKGDGKDVRAFCYKQDAIDGIIRVLIDGLPGNAYNLTNNNENYSIEELAKLLVGTAFVERNLKYAILNPSYGDYVRKDIMDTTKIESLGWMPKISVIEGFRRTVSYYENQYTI